MTETIARCKAHGEATRISCVECGDPICPRCMVRTDVGLKCQEHGAAAKGADLAATTTAAASWPRWLLLLGSLVLIGVAVLIWFQVSGDGDADLAVVEPTGEWVALPDLATVRGTAGLATLPDGTIMAAGGGVSAIALDSTAIFDPESGEWTEASPMVTARRGHTLTVLDDGRILAVGGVSEGALLAGAEIYDPAIGEWAAVDPMSRARVGHSATLLADGTVLVAGGTTPGEAGSGGGQAISPTATSEIFDPASGTWSPGPDMTVARFEHTATSLEDERILMSGGFGPETAPGLFQPGAGSEMFDPVAGVFVGAGSLGEARANHAAARLGDGTVIVVGGVGGEGGDVALATAERFDPARGSWAPLPSLTQARTGATATSLTDGTVLVAGGEGREGGSRRTLASAERLNVTTGLWLPAGNMACPRSEHAALRLDDGSVLVVAGDAAFPGEPPVAQSCVDRYLP